jgi:hypothetical protein
MNKLFFVLCIFMLSGCGRHYTTHRSPLRRPSHREPTIVVSDATNPHSYARTSSHYKKHPIFTIFEYQFFQDHTIPEIGITDQHDQLMISKSALNIILSEIFTALNERQSPLPHCTILHDANFNYSTLCGLIMLKLDDYPLVIKLFRETPESFVSPFTKGFEPTTFFFMSGGSNRHISGLTRIPNRERLLALIEADPFWKTAVRIPRKWYWTPQPLEWLCIDGYHIDGIARLHTEIPATYAIVADYINLDQKTDLDLEAQKKLIMDLATVCSLHLDPHMKNFVISKDGPLVTIIDTEDHSCMTGLTEPITYTNHLEWYAVLTGKFLKNILFNVKQSYDDSYFS